MLQKAVSFFIKKNCCVISKKGVSKQVSKGLKEICCFYVLIASSCLWGVIKGVQMRVQIESEILQEGWGIQETEGDKLTDRQTDRVYVLVYVYV